MKNYPLWLVIALSLLYANCNSRGRPDPPKQMRVEYLQSQGVQKYTIAATDTMIEINSPEFEKIVHYIITEGYTVSERGIACDKEYTFYDSSDNKHILIAIRRNEDDLPSIKAPVTQISVWVNTREPKSDKEIFYYIICPHYIIMPKKNMQHIAAAMGAYQGLLRLANK